MRLHLVVISLVLLAACGDSRVEDVPSMVDSRSDVGLNKKAPVEETWMTVSQGDFIGVGHTGDGIVRLQEFDGLYMVEFQQFKTDKAPDLRVYLSTDGTLNNAIDLGELQSFDGYQTYGVPGFVSIDDYSYVLVHCRAYDVLFARAELQ